MPCPFITYGWPPFTCGWPSFEPGAASWANNWASSMSPPSPSSRPVAIPHGHAAYTDTTPDARPVLGGSHTPLSLSLSLSLSLTHTHTHGSDGRRSLEQAFLNKPDPRQPRSLAKCHRLVGCEHAGGGSCTMQAPGGSCSHLLACDVPNGLELLLENSHLSRGRCKVHVRLYDSLWG